MKLKREKIALLGLVFKAETDDMPRGDFSCYNKIPIRSWMQCFVYDPVAMENTNGK